ncbi:putative drug exporters of the RND superfamily [Thermoplasmatales archaeon BRNA1]|nr:putative drug exporters of the RND superfamily [Thermoplasmatales archaeon BRNA1]
MFASMANFVHKHSKVIVVLWLVVLVCSLPFGLRSGDVLEYDMANMSGAETEGTQGQEIIDEYFSNSIDLSEILVISYSSPAELVQAGAVANKFISLMNGKYAGKIVASNYGSFSKTDAANEGILMVAIAKVDENIDVSDQTGDIRHLVSQAKANVGADLTSYVTGNDAISYDTEKSSMQDVARVDPISVALIFILLALFFYALVTAFVPPAVVGMAYGVVLSLIWGLGQLMGIYYITSTLILVSMLGAGCDYSIFIIARYRDERKKGLDHDVALKEAIMWGGEAVFTSGVSVMIGFAALALCDFSMVQTMGICLALGILMALLAALTFIPAMLNIVGDRIFWPSSIDKYQQTDIESVGLTKKTMRGRLSNIGRGYFGWLARVTTKHAKPLAVVLLVISAPAIYYYATTEDSPDLISVMPDSESVDGLNLIMTQTSGGTIMPTYVVLDLDFNAAKTIGTLQLSETTSVPYVIWNDTELRPGVKVGDMVVGACMTISSELTAKYGPAGTGIAGTISGLNSYDIICNNVRAAMPGATTAQVNAAAISMLPDMVKTPIQSLFYNPLDQQYHYEIDTTTTYLSADPLVSISNVIDGILNVSTGILPANVADSHYVNMMVITTEKPMSENTMAFMKDLQKEFHGENGYDTYVTVSGSNVDVIGASYVSGSSAVMDQITGVVEDQFSMIRIVVIVLLIILLFLILGCYLTPIRAIITIMLSVVWTVALTRFVFDGLMDTPVIWLIPIVLFVVLLGLGMDYEIFLTTKIRENRVKGMDNDTAIEEAVKQAGGVISLCALLMGGTFLSLTLANSSMLQEFGFALGVGILIDGLFMVGFISPSLMHLMGEWSWKGPAFLQRKHVSFENPEEKD